MTLSIIYTKKQAFCSDQNSNTKNFITTFTFSIINAKKNVTEKNF